MTYFAPYSSLFWIKFMKKFFALLILLTLIGSNSYARHIRPDNAAFVYLGRIEVNAPHPLIAWQASSVAINFSGSEVAVGFSDMAGQVFFDVTVDSHTQIIQARDGWLTLPLKLKAGPHYLSLFKRSEASAGQVRFLGIKTDNNEKPLAASVNKHHKKFIFYGDSITAGACNEDGDSDQWETRKTHNAAKSYAAYVANYFDAEYRNVAISGIGISMGYQPYTVDQVWNRLYADPKAPLADLKQFQPDIVFVNYGENDDSFSTRQKQPFPKNWESRYLNFIDQLRVSYPNSQIVILRGGMSGGKNSVRLRKPWQRVVSTAEKKDKKISHYIFDHWNNLHPRVKDHRIMANELTTWLKTQPWF